MLKVTNIHKAFGAQVVLNGVSLSCASGETLGILGKSGCGKTTLLQIIAGLLSADQGEIGFGEESLRGVPPELRNTVYLNQQPLLFPHMTARGNLAFGLEIRGVGKREIEQRTMEMLESLGLMKEAHKYPAELSGGQRQRIAFGRALLVKPRVLLLDEPFASLDADTRSEMQALYLALVTAYGPAALFVTHDVKEALSVGQRFGRMADGKLQLYRERADFIADPETGIAREQAFWKTIQP